MKYTHTHAQSHAGTREYYGTVFQLVNFIYMFHNNSIRAKSLNIVSLLNQIYILTHQLPCTHAQLHTQKHTFTFHTTKPFNFKGVSRIISVI